MKSLLLIFMLLFSTIFSCKEKQVEFDEIELFLQANFTFNSQNLNKYRADYYRLIEEQPIKKINQLEELYAKYESLILMIDEAINYKETNLENIISESNMLLTLVSEILDNRKDNIFIETKLKKANNDGYSLNYIKNRLVIPMTYIFEDASRQNFVADGFQKIEVDSVYMQSYKSGVTLTLASKFGQTYGKNRHVIIDRIEYNGEQKNLNYKIEDNYSFSDIKLDSLKKGTYRLNGILRFYTKDGKRDIPFEKDFKF